VSQETQSEFSAVVGELKSDRLEMCRRVKVLGALTHRPLFCQNVSGALHRGRERCILPGRLREGCRLPEKRVVSPDELLSALKRHLAESGDTEAAVVFRIGVNHHTLRRWLSDKQSPKKGKLALAAAFLRQAGYL
jgi:hypothetical protein